MHYTMQSGVRTERITSRCPTCLAVRVHDDPTYHLDDHSVCCSGECYQQYRAQVMDLLGRAEAWAEQYDPTLLHLPAWEYVIVYQIEGEY